MSTRAASSLVPLNFILNYPTNDLKLSRDIFSLDESEKFPQFNLIKLNGSGPNSKPPALHKLV